MENKIFDNPQQDAATKLQGIIAKEEFEKWYQTLPRWSIEEMDREHIDNLEIDESHETK